MIFRKEIETKENYIMRNYRVLNKQIKDQNFNVIIKIKKMRKIFEKKKKNIKFYNMRNRKNNLVRSFIRDVSRETL